MTALRDFLCAAAARPFAFGECDCALWVCDWIRQRRGVDPGAPFRGRYSTALGCARLLAREGGLLALSSRAFAAAGLAAVDPHQALAGDVALVDGPCGHTLGLIVAARPLRAAMKSDGGFIASAHWPLLAAWRV